MEIYDNLRFLTVTGKPLNGNSAVRQCQGVIDSIYTKLPVDAAQNSLSDAPRPTTTESNVEDDTVLKQCRDFDHVRFEKLFNDGDLSWNDGDHSEADIALAGMFARFTNNAVQIDRLFRQSALMRDKWDNRHHGDGRTYGQGTVDAVLIDAKRLPTAQYSGPADNDGGDIAVQSVTELLKTKFPPMQEIIGYGILPEGCGLMLAGEAKTGKSLMVLEWAIHFSIGRALFDGMIPVPKRRRVVFFQVENPERQMQARLKAMLTGMGINKLPDSIFFADRSFHYDLQDPKCTAKMARVIQGCKADVFIIDPLSSFHSVNENDNVQMRNVLDQITHISVKTGAASIVVHHFGKPQMGQQEKDRTRGASSIQGWYDSHITLTNKAHENKILRLVSIGPLRHGAEPKPILIERDKNFLSHVTEVEMKVTPQQIKDFMKEKFGGQVDTKTQLIKELIAGFDVSDSTAHRAVNEAVDMGYIKTVKGQGKSKRYVSM